MAIIDPQFWFRHDDEQRTLAKELAAVGWTKIYDLVSMDDFPWFIENGITEVFRLPLRHEIWFKNADEAMAFKLWRER